VPGFQYPLSPPHALTVLGMGAGGAAEVLRNQERQPEPASNQTRNAALEAIIIRVSGSSPSSGILKALYRAVMRPSVPRLGRLSLVSSVWHVAGKTPGEAA
jgi:hypothetical protein